MVGDNAATENLRDRICRHQARPASPFDARSISHRLSAYRARGAFKVVDDPSIDTTSLRQADHGYSRPNRRVRDSTPAFNLPTPGRKSPNDLLLTSRGTRALWVLRACFFRSPVSAVNFEGSGVSGVPNLFAGSDLNQLPQPVQCGGRGFLGLQFASLISIQVFQVFVRFRELAPNDHR